MQTSLDFTLLDFQFNDIVQKLLTSCVSAGLDCRPTSGFRSLESQARLWRRSRSRAEVEAELSRLRSEEGGFLADVLEGVGPQKTDKWATNCIPGFSWHNWGQALDCLLFRDDSMIENGDDPHYKTYGDLAKNLGLRWGGDFTGLDKDAGHIQLNQKEVTEIYSLQLVNYHFLICHKRGSRDSAMPPA